jgi:hypothetical protein
MQFRLGFTIVNTMKAVVFTIISGFSSERRTELARDC